MTEGTTIWFTGLPGSGKSTLAAALVPALGARGADVELLDGDEMRQALTKGLGFSREDRETNLRRIAWVARLLNRHGVWAITATISPYRAIREEIRAALPGMIEVFADAPLEVCIERDPKGLYAKALRGELPQFTGVSDPYEPPDHPDVRVDTAASSVDEGVASILARLEAHDRLPPRDRVRVTITVPRYLADGAEGDLAAAIERLAAESLGRRAASAATVSEEDQAVIVERLRALGYLD